MTHDAILGWLDAPDDGTRALDALRAVVGLCARHGVCYFQPCDPRLSCVAEGILDTIADALGVADAD